MTREELLLELHKVKRVCRGLPLFDQAARDSLTAQLAAAQNETDRSVVIQTMASILGLTALMIADDPSTIQSVIYSFQENCGHDFNAVIGTYPFDGQIRDVTCPGCGAAQHFQSPSVG
jgi:phospholipase C